MSNERINLTQFEGMTKGPWRIPEHAAEIVDSEDYAVLWVDFSGESPAEYMFRNSALHCANKEDIEAMAKVPELIAELKRCYEEIDALRGGLDMAHRCLSAHNFRQCDTCGDHYHDDYGPLCGHTASE